ncbi:MAG: MG2 domain-containing protein [Planctomycetota bacterium]
MQHDPHRNPALWCGLIFAALAALSLAAAPDKDRAAEADRLFEDGNYREALDVYRKLFSQPVERNANVGPQLSRAAECLGRLNLAHEFDELVETLTVNAKESWKTQQALAEAMLGAEHRGFLIDGEYRRGTRRRDRGAAANTIARDRVRALRLYREAYETLASMGSAEETTGFFQAWAAVFAYDRWSNGPLWRMQELTDLGTLPKVAEGWHNNRTEPQGAPVDEQGDPVLFGVPDSWDAAANDGERWRWVLAEGVRRNPSGGERLLLDRARFLRAQFGVETIDRFRGPWNRQPGDEDRFASIRKLDELDDRETIARLATGVRKFDLPEEHNHVLLLHGVMQRAQQQDNKRLAAEAARELATVYENRRQLPKAANCWRTVVELVQDPNAQERLDQIVGNWGQFEPAPTQDGDAGAEVFFRYCNARRVELIARRIDTTKLLADVRGYLESQPPKLDRQKLEIENLGYRLVVQGEEKYLGEEAARWSLDLEPPEDHQSARVVITTPLKDAGAYLVTANVADGNTTHVVIWVQDTALVEKPAAGKSLFYVADATTGEPLAGVKLDFFGFRQRQSGDENRYEIDTATRTATTSAEGLAELEVRDEEQPYQWMATAADDSGRMAYLGFGRMWYGYGYGGRRDSAYRQVKVFTITDRPVYRPRQKAQLKFWVRAAAFDLDETSRFAGQTFNVEVRNPTGDVVLKQRLVADAYGGLEAAWTVPDDARLGVYRVNVVNHGGGSFRVEEYKKPEYEVTVETPGEPTPLGGKITAKISARYYYGSPVTEATVKYKVYRYAMEQSWYPPSPWDWLYGPGHWWTTPERLWYPGRSRWGCFGPQPSWGWRPNPPPELVAEQETKIGHDGTVQVVIDTAPAKDAHPDQDHRYRIEAEVVDRSRRTVTGGGGVIASREPFRVYVWSDRGHYQAGDTLKANVAARAASGAAVEASGRLRLLRIEYDDDRPREVEVGGWDLATDEEGLAQLDIRAAQAGQYRLAYETTDKQERTVEGGHFLSVLGLSKPGPDSDNASFRYDALELIPDKRHYAPGETAQLQINCNRPDAAVLLFVRPESGLYGPPRVLRLKGKTAIVPIEIKQTDLPNLFVEAVAVHSGKPHAVVRELFVPPADRLLNVEVAPSADAYLPGQEASLQVRVTDAAGEPFVGSLCASVYDRSLEYISGGSNVADIREFFWKWRRDHRPYTHSNLDRIGYPAGNPGDPVMREVGVFGHVNTRVPKGQLSRGGYGGGEFAARASFAATEASALGQPLASAAVDSVVADPSSPQVYLRKNLADLALWVGTLETDADGMATFECPMPENLTEWKARVWAMGQGTRVGEGTATIVTRKNLVVRLQTPRFLVEGDEAVLSANVHNYLPSDQRVVVRLTAPSDLLSHADDPERTVTIEAGGERRIDWRVSALAEGDLTVSVSAQGEDESDGMQVELPIHVRGVLQTESYTGVIRPGEDSAKFVVDVPEDRRPEETKLEIVYTPSLATTMLDTLPYLIDYPHGCTEQTLNRFLPAVICRQTLKNIGLSLSDIRPAEGGAFPEEHGPEDHGAAPPERAPVRSDAELDAIVAAGLERLESMQLSDGGWGWFSGWGERSSPHTTAVVVRGLLLAEASGVVVPKQMLRRGAEWLAGHQQLQIEMLQRWPHRELPKNKGLPVKEHADNQDALTMLVLAEADVQTSEMTQLLFRDRTRLSPYGLAAFGLALEKVDDQSKHDAVLRNLMQFVQQDDSNQTAWLEIPGGYWWYWYGDDIETHAMMLKLLVAAGGEDELASRLVKYLVNNRKNAAYWKSTRDTAMVVEAMADYLRASGEDQPTAEVEVWVDGERRQSVSIDSSNLLSGEHRLMLGAEELPAGPHTVEIRKTGTSPLYYSGYLTNFTTEADIEPAGLELQVKRRYYRVVRDAKIGTVPGSRGDVVEQTEDGERRIAITDREQLVSGDLVEVELTIESKNDYEYILLEDRKAAGFEPVEVRSGYNGNQLGAYVEYRDDRVNLYATRMPRGRHSVTYRLRAETPGAFSAMPTSISAMYAPRLAGNSANQNVRIED